MDIEQELQDKGLTAIPRVTQENLELLIKEEKYHVFKEEKYHVFEGTSLTVCCLVLKSGFCVIGDSASINPDNFNVEMGRKIAKEKAIGKMWALEGYRILSAQSC